MRIFLGLAGFGAIAALALVLLDQKSRLAAALVFDAQKLEAAAASGAPALLSTALPADVATVCVFGPYHSVEFMGSSAVDAELAGQMDPSEVGESYVRMATFDDQSKILSEYDFPRMRGPVRIAADGMPSGFCAAAETLMIEVVEHEGFVTVRFSE